MASLIGLQVNCIIPQSQVDGAYHVNLTTVVCFPNFLWTLLPISTVSYLLLGQSNVAAKHQSCGSLFSVTFLLVSSPDLRSATYGSADWWLPWELLICRPSSPRLDRSVCLYTNDSAENHALLVSVLVSVLASVLASVLGSVTLQNVYINLDEPRASYKLQVALPETIHLIFLSSEREAYPDHPLCTVIGVIWQLSRCAREEWKSDRIINCSS